jgi:protein-S-isoprenylcysteine O-methyltransferase Ste14
MSTLELKIPPPVVALLVCATMWAVSHAGPSLDPALIPRVAAFLGIALTGGVIAFLGAVELKRAKTTVNPFKPQDSSALVTSGIYRFTRNPMYVGLAFVVLGWAAFLGSAWALAGPALFVLYINRFQIGPEEAFLAAKFETPYAEYRSHVRRWL